MARKSRDEDLLMEDELTAAFLGDDDLDQPTNDSGQAEQPSRLRMNGKKKTLYQAN